MHLLVAICHQNPRVILWCSKPVYGTGLHSCALSSDCLQLHRGIEGAALFQSSLSLSLPDSQMPSIRMQIQSHCQSAQRFFVALLRHMNEAQDFASVSHVLECWKNTQVNLLFCCRDSLFSTQGKGKRKE